MTKRKALELSLLSLSLDGRALHLFSLALEGRGLG